MKADHRGWIRTAEGWEHTDPRMQEILAWMKGGMPHKEIARLYEISETRVSRIRRRAGLEPRPRGRIKVIHKPSSLLG